MYPAKVFCSKNPIISSYDICFSIYFNVLHNWICEAILFN